MSVWTDEKIDALKALWSQPGPELSFAAIGERLGFNRNAIAGKCSRLGLKRGRIVTTTGPRKTSPGEVTLAAPGSTRKRNVVEPLGEIVSPQEPATATAAIDGAGDVPPPPDTVSPSAQAVRATPAAGKARTRRSPEKPAPKPKSTEEMLFGDVVAAAHSQNRPIPVGARDDELDGLPMPGLGLMELNERTCHWPLGDPLRPDFFFCGRSIASGNVYCRFHLGVRVSKYHRRPQVSAAPVRALPPQAFA